MKISNRLVLGLFVSVLAFSSFSTFADKDENQSCRLRGSYGYIYNGTSFGRFGPVPLTETGFLNIDNAGNISGEGTLAFYFSNFGGTGTPLWLLMHEVQSSGIVTPDTNIKCTGSFDYVATATVIKTSNPDLIPEGFVLFTDAPRSITYTISGPGKNTLDMVSTSPGTIASGTAHKQLIRR